MPHTRHSVKEAHARLASGRSLSTIDDLRILVDFYSKKRRWDEADSLSSYMVDVVDYGAAGSLRLPPWRENFSKTRRSASVVLILLAIVMQWLAIFQVHHSYLLSEICCSCFPANTTALLFRARHHRDRLEYEQAADDCDRVLEQEPANQAALIIKAHCRLALGACMPGTGALVALTSPDAAAYCFAIAQWWLQRGEYTEAAMQFQRSARALLSYRGNQRPFDNKISKAFLASSGAWWRAHNYEEALEAAALAELYASSWKDASDAVCMQAYCLFCQSKYHQSFILCNRALELCPDARFAQVLKKNVAEILREKQSPVLTGAVTFW